MEDRQRLVNWITAVLVIVAVVAWLIVWFLYEMMPDPEPWPPTHPPSITPSTTYSPAATDTPTPVATRTPTSVATRTPTSVATRTPTSVATGILTPTSTLGPSTPTRWPTESPKLPTPESLPETGGSVAQEEIIGGGVTEYLARQLPVASVLLVGFYFVARYAAGLMDKLLAQQAAANKRLGQIIDRNTEAWREATVTLVRLTEGVAHLLSIELAHAEEVKLMVRELANIRTILATRPCVGLEVVQEDEERAPQE